MDDFFSASQAMNDHEAATKTLRFLMSLCLTAGVVGFIVFLGERALGFDLKEAINDIEAESRKGNVWPVAVLLCTGMVTASYLLGGFGHS